MVRADGGRGSGPRHRVGHRRFLDCEWRAAAAAAVHGSGKALRCAGTRSEARIAVPGDSGECQSFQRLAKELRVVRTTRAASALFHESDRRWRAGAHRRGAIYCPDLCDARIGRAAGQGIHGRGGPAGRAECRGDFRFPVAATIRRQPRRTRQNGAAGRAPLRNHRRPAGGFPLSEGKAAQRAHRIPGARGRFRSCRSRLCEGPRHGQLQLRGADSPETGSRAGAGGQKR